MLVDLGRNDLGRVCSKGSVQVKSADLMVIERYSHVMHIVSNVVGELADDKTAWDLLKAVFRPVLSVVHPRSGPWKLSMS